MHCVKSFSGESALPESVRETFVGPFVLAEITGTEEEIEEATLAYAQLFPIQDFETSCASDAICIKEATWGENVFDIYKLVVIRKAAS